MVDLRKKDVADLDERARFIQAYIDHANDDTGYEYDRYVKHGASPHAEVVTARTGEFQECILWCANHYLSLNRKPRVVERAAEDIREYGTGCGTSAASCGMSALHKQVEERVARLVGKEKAVLFPTGFTANVGAIAQLAGKRDLIIFDRECHASIIDGLKLSEAKWVSFRHNKVDSLAAKLSHYQGNYENIFVVVESAYSMSGDLAPLTEIVALKECYQFLLYVDEAHSFGIYGDRGQGYCHDQGVSEQVDFLMATLSKATASVGGFVAAKEQYCSLLRWSDPYVFQACIPPADAAAILAALDEIENHPELITDLHDKNRYMRDRLRARGFELGNSRSPIIPIFIEDYHKLHEVVRDLYAEGIYSTPICFPAVKAHEGRIRLILNAAHTRDDIEITVDALERLCHKHQVLEKTGGNKFDFSSLLDSSTAQANQDGEMLTMAIMRIMNIDSIIRDFPLDTAERVIDRLEKLIRHTLRADDRVGRYEQDKLGIVLKDIDRPHAAGLCRRLIDKVDEYRWDRIAMGLTVNTSIHIVETSGQALAS